MMNIKNLILNLEKDGDTYYHIHHKICTNAPQSNYIELTKIKDLFDLKRLNHNINIGNISMCSKCLDNKDMDNIKTFFYYLTLI